MCKAADASGEDGLYLRTVNAIGVLHFDGIERSQSADYPVEVITGPEFVTGSTRMKAGSSQKMILDIISTSLQIRQGRVEGNKMVNAKLINHKLIDRACRIFMERNPEYTDYEEVKQLILKAGSVRKAEDLLKNKSDLDI